MLGHSSYSYRSRDQLQYLELVWESFRNGSVLGKCTKTKVHKRPPEFVDSPFGHGRSAKSHLQNKARSLFKDDSKQGHLSAFEGVSGFIVLWCFPLSWWPAFAPSTQLEGSEGHTHKGHRENVRGDQTPLKPPDVETYYTPWRQVKRHPP